VNWPPVVAADRKGCATVVNTGAESPATTPPVMTVSYLQQEIERLAQFPHMPTSKVIDKMYECCGNIGKLEKLYDELMEDCYGDDSY
jgi:hypothetical protein